MSSLKNKIKKNLFFLSILLVVLNLVFFFSTNYETSIDEDKIVKIFLEDRSILPRILDKLEILNFSTIIVVIVKEVFQKLWS